VIVDPARRSLPVSAVSSPMDYVSPVRTIRLNGLLPLFIAIL